MPEAPLAHAVPGIRRYVQSHIVDERTRPDIPPLGACRSIEAGSGFPGDRRAYGGLGAFEAPSMEIDGIAELWYDDREAMARAHATPEAKTLHADGARFIGRIKSFIVEEKIIIPK